MRSLLLRSLLLRSLFPQSLKFFVFLLASTVCFAAQTDRIAGPIDATPAISLAKSLHPKAQPQNDLGAIDPSFKLSYMTVFLAPSASQQADLDQLLADQQNRSSINYHKWLTPQQFADRFGLSQNDLNKVSAWLEGQGFEILSVGGGRNAVNFSGTAAQVQRAFGTEIHNYKVGEETHFANSTPLMVPVALNGIVRSVLGANSFLPRPASRRRQFAPRRSSHGDYYDSTYVFPNFLAPGDLATIYDINSLYNASTPIDGTGQKLAIVGQTDIYLADINDFRGGFGLSTIPFSTTATTGSCTVNASGLVISPCDTTNLQYVLVAGSSDPLTTYGCGDLGESDLDIEWSGAVARNAQIVFVNAPVTYPSGCNSNPSGLGVFASLTAVINPSSGPVLAPVVSMSYGNCEAQAQDLESLLQQGNAEGVTIMNSSGDVGSATCDFNPPNSAPPYSAAVNGLAVSYPASSPEVTGVGGTEISLADDSYPNPSAFWSTTIGPTGGTAVSYIPELGWNDDEEFQLYCQNPYSGDTFCSQGGSPKVNGWVPLTASSTAADVQEDIWISIGGGGASNCWTKTPQSMCSAGFPQPTWQQGLSVANAPTGLRYVPDVSFFASPNFPGYIFCTPQNAPTTITSTCAVSISDALDTYESIVGGTSASSPVFAGIVTLLNQYLGADGLGNINSTLYELAKTPANGAFHPVTSGNNFVSCQGGTPAGFPSEIKCPGATGSVGTIGFDASDADSATGYNLVAGLGSVDVSKLFAAWTATRSSSSVTISSSATNVYEGNGVTFTATVVPAAGVGSVTFSTTNGSSTTVLGAAVLNMPYPTATTGTATFATTALPTGSNSVTATYDGDGSHNSSVSAATTVTVTIPFTMTPTPTTLSVPAGQTASSTITITPASGFTGTVSFTNSTASSVGSCTAGLPTGALCSFSPTSVTLDGIPAHTVNVVVTIATAANMTLPSGAQTITVSGTSGNATVTTTVSLTVTATNQSFTLGDGQVATFTTAVGGTAAVNVTVTGAGSPANFVTNNVTALPITYTCTGSPSLTTSEISCQVSPGNGQPTSATAVTVSLVTTPKTNALRPVGGGNIAFVMLLPGLFGVLFAAGSRKRGVRLLSLVVVLGVSTMWMGACGGSSSNTQSNPGTPAGSYAVTINATTGGTNPLTATLPVTLTVSQ
jgi:hypothetical protein